MLGIKTKKHKQSKYFTVMLIPYSSQKTKNLRIPHWIFYAVFGTAAGLMLGAFLISLRASYFKNHAESLNVEWSSSIELNSQLLEEKQEVERQLLEEKQEIESSAEKQKENFEQQLDSYESKLEYFHEKARELEERIDELNDVREEIYNMLSTSTDRPIAFFMPDTSVGGPHIAVMSNYDNTAVTLETVFRNLERRVTVETLEYDSLLSEVKKVRSYLDAKPSIWPVYGIVTSEMGRRPNPFGSGLEAHSGIDIAVPTGTQVRATGYGTITFSDWEAGYGYLVIIDHGYGYETFYGHNSRLLFNVGDRVSRGDIIAMSGSTGRSTGPHVHYEVRLDGEILNPRNFLR
jgi:murein DD-endopeptidase MepM/ murein hydrolase activator NlpD